MSKPPLMSVAEARSRILALAEPVGEETASLLDAAGRVLAEDVEARRTQPPFAASAMDGYAVRAADARSGATLRVVGEIAAGARADRPLAPGEAMRIFTGAPLPDGADAILLQEDARREGDWVHVAPAKADDAVSPGAWVRPAGGDFHEGERLLRAPRRLSAEDVALAAAAGRSWLTVRRRPRIALLAVGDELTLPGDPRGPADIVSSNNFGVAALLRAAGAEPVIFPLIRDDLDALGAALEAARGFDALATLGGASEGDLDLARPAFGAAQVGLDFYRIAMRPGKPLSAGRFPRGGPVALGLPGNPVSALVCARLFLAPLVDALLGLPADGPPTSPRALAEAVDKNGPREHYMRATREPDGRVRPVDDQDSSLLTRLSRADALIVRPPFDPPRAAGEAVACIMLRGSQV